MKISIITAVYNGDNSIAATLRSVAQQDHDDIEHIVVDGASSDATLATVRANDERVTRVISEPDNGPYDAFNKGLRCATGDAVAFLNSGDTYVSDGAVSRMVRALSEDGVRAVFADVSIVDSKDQCRLIRRYSSARFTPKGMSYGLMPAHPTLFLRREVFLQVGEYDPSFRIAGDFEHCLRVFVKATTPYRYVDEAIVRMPTGGISNRGWRSKLTITREMYKACMMNNVNTNFGKLCLRIPLKMLEMI
jgi:glycosyltransferase involved in cell wall biosynthesis